ncbi:MAG: putative signal transducing protein [Sphingosinicella sp.]
MALVELCTCDNALEAGVVRGRLESEGVAVFLFDLEVNIGAPIMLPVRLLVSDDEVEKARQVLAEMAAEGGVSWDAPTR